MREEQEQITPRLLWAALAGLVLLSLTLRLVGIDWGLPNYDPEVLPHTPYRSSYHIDEDNFLWGLALMHRDADFDVRVYHWGTLQFFLIDGMLLLGSGLGVVPAPWEKSYIEGNAEAIPRLYILGRLVSVLFGVGCTLVVALLARTLAGWRAGLAAGAAYAIAPLAVMGGHYLTNDVTMSALVAGSVLASAIAVTRTDWRWLALGGFLLGLGTAAKYSGASALPGLLAGQALLMRSYGKGLSRKWFLVFLLVPWLALAAGFVLGEPYAIFAPDRVIDGIREARGGNELNLSSGAGAIARMLWGQASALGMYGLTLPLALLALGGVVLLAASVLRPRWRRFRAGTEEGGWRGPHPGASLVLLAALAGCLVGVALNRIPMLRYTHPVVPLLAVAAGVLWASLPGRPVRWAAGALAAGVALWVTLGQLSLLTGPHPANLLDAWIRANVPEGHTIARLWPEYPILDPRKYPLIRIDPWEPDLPLDARPPYIIYDDMALFPANANMVSLLSSEYEEVARIGRNPTVLGFTWDEGEPPHDWKYSHPEFTVYRRR